MNIDIKKKFPSWIPPINNFSNKKKIYEKVDITELLVDRKINYDNKIEEEKKTFNTNKRIVKNFKL